MTRIEKLIIVVLSVLALSFLGRIVGLRRKSRSQALPRLLRRSFRSTLVRGKPIFSNH
jgi:hypothetical protein